MKRRTSARYMRRNSFPRDPYKLLFENMLNGVAFCRMIYEGDIPVDFQYLTVNDKFAELTGLRDVVGRRVSEVIPGIRQTNPELFETYGRVASSGNPEKFEIYLESLDLWLSISVYSPDKGFFVAVFDNITEGKRADWEREKTIELLKLINAAENTHNLIHTVTSYLQHWSNCEAIGVRLREGDDFPYYEARGFPQEFVELERSLCGYDEQGNVILDAAGKPFLECMCGNVIAGRTDPAKSFFTEKGSFWSNCTTELLASTSDADRGTHTRNRCNAAGYESVALIPLSTGSETIGLLQVNDRRKNRFTPRFITLLERFADSIAISLAYRKANKLLADSERRYRLLYETMEQGIVYQDKEGRIISANPAAEKLLGMSFEQMQGRTSADPRWETVYEDGSPRPGDAHPAMIALRTGKHCLQQTMGVFHPPTKTTRWLLIDAIPEFRENEESPYQVYTTFSDITDRKVAEEERQKANDLLLKTQKLESLGILAGGIAHDFNNLLGGIFGYVELALSFGEGNNGVTTNLSRCMKVLERARALSKQLLTFAKGGQPMLTTASLEALIRETVDFALAGTSVSCGFEFPNDLWPVDFDINQMGQVFDNIVINAVQAIAGEGRIAIAATNELSDSRTYPPLLQSGRYVHITVKDFGPGITKENLGRIFDPFFTTKSEGSGLGLTTSFSIVKKHGGFIDVESEPGNGTMFHIWLPASEKGKQSETGKPVPQGKIESPSRILFMDDEEYIRDIGKKLLTRLGYSVTVAVDGTEAYSLVKTGVENGQPFDCVILDLTIPGGIGGKEAAAVIHEIDPRINIIASSGYSNDPIMSRPDQFGFSGSLMKPYSSDELASVLSRVLKR